MTLIHEIQFLLCRIINVTEQHDRCYKGFLHVLSTSRYVILYIKVLFRCLSSVKISSKYLLL